MKSSFVTSHISVEDYFQASQPEAGAVSLGLEITSGSACVCPTQLGQ